MQVGPLWLAEGLLEQDVGFLVALALALVGRAGHGRMRRWSCGWGCGGCGGHCCGGIGGGVELRVVRSFELREGVSWDWTGRFSRTALISVGALAPGCLADAT